jgi:pimeloyl-ACP methyl ester carboxylesterase
METVRRIEVPSAVLSYRRAGQGPAVLLIQGVGVVGEGWRPQIDGLADRHTTISFDNRGIGESRLLEGKPTIEAMARDAIAILDAEGIDRAHVVGHSMGGVIAQEIALAAPARVRSLAFLCTFARGKQGAIPSLGMIVTGIRTRVGTAAMRRSAFLEIVMPRTVLASRDRAQLAEELRPLFGRDLAQQPPIVFQQLSAMAKYDAVARLNRLAAIPTLVVAGAVDRVARPAFGRELAGAIPGARYVELAGASHGAPIHAAADINRMLAEHFAAA